MTRTQFARAVAAVGAAVFAVLAAVAGRHPTPGAVDGAAHAVLLDAVGGPSRVPLVQWVTWLGNHDTIVAAVTLASVACLAAGKPWWTLRFLAASGLGGLVVRALKAVFSRDRPLEAVVEAAGWSFPSGHAFASTVFYGLVVALVCRITRRPGVRAAAAVAGAVVIGAVGLSRVALGVHYLSDVAAGWAAGAAWLALSQLAVDAVQRRVRSSGAR